MNAKQRVIRAGIRQAKRTDTAFKMVALQSSNELKSVDEKTVKAKLEAEYNQPHPDKRKIKHLKSMLA